MASTQPTKAGTFLMVLFLAFGLALFPVNSKLGEQKEPGAPYASTVGKSAYFLVLISEVVSQQTNDDDDDDEHNNNNNNNNNNNALSNYWLLLVINSVLVIISVFTVIFILFPCS